MTGIQEIKHPLGQAGSSQAFILDLINGIYTQLFTQINGIVSATQTLHTDSYGALQQSAEKISTEMDSLYQVDKELLLPFALAAEENEITGSCKLRKDIKRHYGAMLRAINELKDYLRVCNAQEGSPLLLSAIMESLLVFEQQHLFIQVLKNKYLHVPVKSCSTCNPNC